MQSPTSFEASWPALADSQNRAPSTDESGADTCEKCGGTGSWPGSMHVFARHQGGELLRRGSINHLDLTVLDPSASEPFYRSVLGFMGFVPRRLAHGNTQLPLFHSTEAGQQLFSIALQRAKDPLPHDRARPGLHHIAFSAASRDDVDRLHALLVEIGARVLDAPAEYPEYAPGYYAVFFTDPDGLKFEFVHMPNEPEFAPSE